MTTKHPRINVVVDQDILSSLTFLAEQNHKSLSMITRELIEEALDLHEDKLLADLATKRDVPGVKRIKHQDAWGNDVRH